MATNQNISSRTASREGLGSIRTASTICLIAGIWFFVSPWVYNAYMHGNAWNNWIVGGLIVLWSAIRLIRPAYSTGLSWYNTVCGAWVFCSPWIYGYIVHSDRWINSMCVGFVVMVFSIMSARVGARSQAAPLHG